jgi:hypothetical protein
MRSNCLLPVLVMFVIAVPTALLAQEHGPPADAEAPLLTLDEAVSTALSHNWLVKNVVLEAQKYDFRLDTARSKRLPQFQLSTLGGELMHSFDFTFPAGSWAPIRGLGRYPRPNR